MLGNKLCCGYIYHWIATLNCYFRDQTFNEETESKIQKWRMQKKIAKGKNFNSIFSLLWTRRATTNNWYNQYNGFLCAFWKIQICQSLGQSIEINTMKQRKCSKKYKKGTKFTRQVNPACNHTDSNPHRQTYTACCDKSSDSATKTMG